MIWPAHVAAAAREADSAAEDCEIFKHPGSSHLPVAVKSFGPINASCRVFLSKLGRKLANQSGDAREISFLFQRLRSDSPVQYYLTA